MYYAYAQDPEMKLNLGIRRRLAPLSFPFRVARLDFSRFDLIHAQGDDQWIRRRSSPPVVRTLHGSCVVSSTTSCRKMNFGTRYDPRM